MPDKMLRPEDFSRPTSRPEISSESKDLTAHNMDFRPTQTTERPGWKPQSNQHSVSQSEWISIESAVFHDMPQMQRREGKDPVQKTVQASSYSARILGGAVVGEYIYAMLGLLLGLASILGGVTLGLHGIVGHTSWTAKILGFESSINDAAPGVVLFIVGVFVVWITKPKVKLGDLKG